MAAGIINEYFVLNIDVLDARRMYKSHDLSDFDMGQTVIAG